MGNKTWFVLFLIVTALPHGAIAKDFKDSFAIVIGVNEYPDSNFSKLENAEADAVAMSNYLTAQGYVVDLLLGYKHATKNNLESSIRRVSKNISQDSRFLFFFAGHGHNENQEGQDIAYLVFPSEKQDATGSIQFVSSGDIAHYSKVLDLVRHQLFLFDSCYSGLMGTFGTRSINQKRYDSEQYLVDSLRKRKVRQFLSAGGAHQQVLDGGPNGLSWFTYFMLKALEPKVSSNRSSGLITFSEFASFVQTRSANPRHTPAFGSMSGHEGGEYLFRDTSQGNPRIKSQPRLSTDILYKLGFLTRSGDMTGVYNALPDMKMPIENLFKAWKDLDIQLYLSQFSREVIQTGRYASGHMYTRGYQQIEAQRTQFFPKLKSVEIPKFELMYQGYSNGVATFGVKYSMVFNLLNGKVIREQNVTECYEVERDAQAGKWFIRRNDDYQTAICKAHQS